MLSKGTSNGAVEELVLQEISLLPAHARYSTGTPVDALPSVTWGSENLAKCWPASVPLFNGMTERSGVVANADVPCDYDYEGRFAQRCRGRQMNRVQSANGFDREAARSLGENRFRDARKMRTPGKPLDGEQRCSLLLRRDPSRQSCAKDGAATFSERESGRDPLTRSAN